jgi:hypothetical protein
MAYMSQETKKKLAANVRRVMPRDWKYSLAVRHHSTIVLTITSAPVDLLGIRTKRVAEEWEKRGDKYQPETYAQLNVYHLDSEFSGDLLKIFERIKTALNEGNHDRSDSQTDYFDVGWYVDINIGRWDKPFQVTPAKKYSNPDMALTAEPTYEQLKARLAELQPNPPEPAKPRMTWNCRTRKQSQFHIRQGAIVDGFGAVLYFAEEIADLSDAAKVRLAEIHTQDETADWEKANQILECEGLL